MRLLLTGSTGQLGRALQAHLAARPLPGLVVVPADRALLDLSRPDDLPAALDALRPDLVVNAAAYTAVDRAESEPDLAFRVNAEAPGVLAREAARRGIGLIHFSTDYVFDGTKAGRYVEDDLTNPLSVYGRSKLAGERAVLDAGAAAVVFRTTWVFHDEGANFLKTMLRLAMERDTLRVVADQRGAPTWAGRLAQLVRTVVAPAEGGTSASGEGFALAMPSGPRDAEAVANRLAAHRGVFHASASGETTWADYARWIIATAVAHPAARGRLRARPESVEGIGTADWPTPARRPANSLLDCAKLERAFDFVFPDWKGDVEACVRRLLDQRSGGN